jgi:hypothetical protein
MRQDSWCAQHEYRSVGLDVARECVPNADAPWRAGEGVRIPSRSRRGLALIVYSVLSGTIAFALGAALSLAVQGSQRLAVWSAGTGVVAVAAGVAHESRLLTDCRLACGRWLRRLARLSPIS